MKGNMTSEELIKGYELTEDEDFWRESRSGKLCLKHSSHQKIARKEGFRIKEMRPISSTEDLVRLLVIMVATGVDKEGKMGRSW